MKDYTFLAFIRDIGKHITVNYMMAKDSVKKRISGEAGEGMSFTEFSYQLLQGYDYLYLSGRWGGAGSNWADLTNGGEILQPAQNSFVVWIAATHSDWYALS